MLTIVLPTGRVLKDALSLMEKTGIPVEKINERGRKLIVNDGAFRFIFAKPMDVPLHISHGTADIGFVGSDVMKELDVPLVELVDTGRGKCRMVVAGPPELEPRFCGHESGLMWLTVATKYPNIADRHFSSLGVQVQILNLHGSIELAPEIGLSDCILDIVQTGRTLKANNLKILDNVIPVSLYLAGNKKSSQFKWEEISNIVHRIKEIKEGEDFEQGLREEDFRNNDYLQMDR